MSCSGTCTARIFETRNLKADRWPNGMDQETAIRFLSSVVKDRSTPKKESGCDDGCLCSPLADYLPDPATGKSKKEPEWTVWTVTNVITYGKGPNGDELIFGNVEHRSAIVPGLCDTDQWLDLPKHSAPPHKSAPSEQKPPSDKKK